MSFRNLSPGRMFEALAAAHRQRLAFPGGGVAELEAWKGEALPAVLATLGHSPPGVPARPQLLAEWEHRGLRKQRWLIDVQPHLAATCLVNLPPGAVEGERYPAILCWHGHGPFGKEPVMGNDSSPELRAAIAAHNYDYGQQMAQLGVCDLRH